MHRPTLALCVCIHSFVILLPKKAQRRRHRGWEWKPIGWWWFGREEEEQARYLSLNRTQERGTLYRRRFHDRPDRLNWPFNAMSEQNSKNSKLEGDELTDRLDQPFNAKGQACIVSCLRSDWKPVLECWSWSRYQSDGCTISMISILQSLLEMAGYVDLNPTDCQSNVSGEIQQLLVVEAPWLTKQNQTNWWCKCNETTAQAMKDIYLAFNHVYHWTKAAVCGKNLFPWLDYVAAREMSVKQRGL